MHMDRLFFFRGENKFVGNIWCPRHDTHPRNTQTLAGTQNHFQSSKWDRRTHILARPGSCRKNWSDGFWLFVCTCWNIINPFFCHFGEGVCSWSCVWVCVWERLFQADGGSRGPFCRVNGEKLTSTDCCLPSSPFSPRVLSSRHPSKSASTPTPAFSSHPSSSPFIYFFIFSCLV